MILEDEKKRNYILWTILLFLTGFIFRVIMAGQSLGHVSDLNCFISWADRIMETGTSGFYSDTVFTDYPPGYMYVLFIIGGIRKLFYLENDSFANLVLMKFPAILCDMGIGFFLYKIAGKKGERFSFFAAILFLFNPAVFINSSVWGQVDSVFSLCVVIVCYLVTVRRMPLSYFVFAIGILIKPQTLIFTPIVLYGVWDTVFQREEKKEIRKEFSRQSIWALLSILFLLLGMAPFGIDTVLAQYGTTMTSYPYATVNAHNIWNIFGLNWCEQTGTFLGITYSKWGTMGIFSAVMAATYFWQIGKEKKEKYFICGAIIIGGMFLLSVRMHERYLYPIVALLLTAYVISKEKKWLVSCLLFSLGHFLNVYYVLYQKKETVGFKMIPCMISVFILISYGYFIYQGIFLWKEKKEPGQEKNLACQILALARCHNSDNLPLRAMCIPRRDLFSYRMQFPIREQNQTGENPIEIDKRLHKKDFIIIMFLTLCYGILAFYDLGEKKAPVSFFEIQDARQSVVLDFGVSTYINEFYYYLGNYENRHFTLEVSEDAEGPYRYVTDIQMESVFAWDGITVNDKGQYWRLISEDRIAVIGELMFYDFDNRLTTPVESIGSGDALFDEQDIFDGRSSFRNSTYFDEIYHARTAYEYLNGLYSYENTHPPLGKILIALGMKIFGVNPFGWRFMGTLFGVLMVPLIYLFGKKIGKTTFWATVITLLFTFDFMHFVQTRIATIDVFVTFFIILMYYFMYRYLESDHKKWLAFCGITMGFGVACKWTGIYAGAGLGIIFFYHLWKNYRQSEDKKGYQREIIRTGFLCILFFILIPVGIYILSYLPFSDGSGNGLIEQMLSNQQSMLSYHAGIEASHPFSSWWYQWPVMYRPIWYYSGMITEEIKEGISAFGNPAVWWAGIPAFIFCIYLSAAKKDKCALFLVVSYLAQYLPWFFITRITFIYHYFPSMPFVTLMIGYSLKELMKQEGTNGKRMVLVYTGIVIGMFILFYPVLSGQGVSKNYVEHFLRWFDSWVLI